MSASQTGEDCALDPVLQLGAERAQRQRAGLAHGRGRSRPALRAIGDQRAGNRQALRRAGSAR